ncbi:hypothetical protein HW555_004538 [Spodoptera exigua]|uniref:Uncharacterized protein n=1 Tax=Spodoptera exigua TaxID=7107 RepID=A0A835GJG8_SPOEX|nr:hypothetical protein HW555_004538 [Spodoptera exigua]
MSTPVNIHYERERVQFRSALNTRVLRGKPRFVTPHGSRVLQAFRERNVLCEIMECKGASCMDSAERMLPTDTRRYTFAILEYTHKSYVL